MGLFRRASPSSTSSESPREASAASSHRLAFVCNVCGAENAVPSAQIGRETPSCRCGSTVRMRSIVHTLSVELFGRCMPIAEFPDDAKLRGIGTSDWRGYADRLAAKLDYTNTYYHTEPRLDITAPDPSLEGTLDFLVSSDVFEHVEPPVERAFAAARRLLKPDGVFVFSVPYTLEPATVEHFPELGEWSIVTPPDGRRELHNRTADGREQVFRDLVFHGGEGATLEMRVFSLAGIERAARQCGFGPPRVYTESHLACGTVWEVSWSLTMALRPA